MLCHTCSRFGILALLTDTPLFKEEQLNKEQRRIELQFSFHQGASFWTPPESVCVSVSDTARQLNYYLPHHSPETHSREKNLDIPTFSWRQVPGAGEAEQTDPALTMVRGSFMPASWK